MDALDICGDTLPVTVVKISDNDSDPAVTLFYLVAGGILDDMDFSNERWEVTTRELRNDELHGQIQEHCKHDFLNTVLSDKRKRFKKNTPAFTVTEVLPSFDVQFDCLKPKPEDIGDRKAYRYTHSKNRELFVRVFEPASPSETDISVPGFSLKHTKLVSTLT